MSSSIRKNFFYSSILTTSGYIFPLLTYPYVARVLGVEHLGTNNFVSNVVSYFISFSMMGVGILGTREIAGAMKEERNSVFSSLFMLSLCSTILSAIILFITSFFVPKLLQNQMMFFAGSLNIVFNCFQMEWLFKGMEDFKYITMRSLSLKIVYVILVYMLVRNSNDYDILYYISVSITFANALINAIYSRKHVRFTLNGVNLKKYIKPFLIFGLYMIFGSLYTTLNVGILGIICNDIEVGYYTTATKIYGIILSLFTAFTGVMMPRMSSLLSEGKIDEFRRITLRSYNILMMFATPIMLYFMIMAPQIIMLIAGSGYEGAIVPMRIVMPLVIVIGIEQILIIQTLMPLRKDKLILRNTIIGGFVGLIANIILVPNLKSIGSAIVWTLSELTIMLLSIQCVKNCIPFNFPFKKFVSTILYYIPMAIILFFNTMLWNNKYICIISSLLILLFYCYIVSAKLLRDFDMIYILNKITNIFIKTSR